MKSIYSKQAGLTSIQVLVVVIVLGIIAAVLLAPRLLGQAGRALQAQAAEDIETLGIALDRYAKDNGDYPSTEQGLKALWEKPEAPPSPIGWLWTLHSNPDYRKIRGGTLTSMSAPVSMIGTGMISSLSAATVLKVERVRQKMSSVGFGVMSNSEE